VDEKLAAAKERGWREVAAIDAAYEADEIGERGWHEAMAALVVSAYLGGETPAAGSGSSRDAEGWERARSGIAEAVEPGWAFLDVGCANGYLMESMAAWAGVEPYGVDISPELAELARRRLPQWADRIWVGNAAEWEPPRRFDAIRTGLDYVENAERGTPGVEDEIVSWGYEIAGRKRARSPASAARLQGVLDRRLVTDCYLALRLLLGSQARGRFLATPGRRGKPGGVGPVFRRTMKPGGPASTSAAIFPATRATAPASADGPTHKMTAPPSSTRGRHHSAATGGCASAFATATL